MAFDDPQSVDPGSGAVSLPNVTKGDGTSKYLSADGNLELVTGNQYGRRTRRQIRLNHKKISADAFIPEQNRENSASIYVVFDEPAVGYSNAEMLDLWEGFAANLAATSNENIVKLLGGEN